MLLHHKDEHMQNQQGQRVSVLMSICAEGNDHRHKRGISRSLDVLYMQAGTLKSHPVDSHTLPCI